MNSQKIESKDNPRLKLVRKIRDGLEPAFIFVEGVRLAEEAVRSNLAIEFCLFENSTESEPRQSDLLESVWSKTTHIFEVDRSLFLAISDTRSPQGIILIGKRPKADRAAFEIEFKRRSAALPLTVLLSEINNPSNLGAVARAAEAAGAAGIVISKNSADIFSPKALRGSMGSAFRMPIWAGATNAETIDWARSNGVSVVGATADAACSYTELAWAKPRMLVLGSEAHGIPADIESELDERISIPMDSNVESLNLAVAAGIILFEARRQVENNNQV
jgi:TrmH family RNA methyltransferase